MDEVFVSLCGKDFVVQVENLHLQKWFRRLILSGQFVSDIAIFVPKRDVKLQPTLSGQYSRL